MEQKTALLTGVTSGFGKVIAAHLVDEGYHLIILGRSEEKLEQLRMDLLNRSGEVKIDMIRCDLSSLRSIEEACKEVVAANSPIDLLLLNAGLWNFQFIQTEDQIEETLQVNLVAPVIIYRLLKAQIPHNGESKVIFTSSGLHQGKINFRDLNFRENFSGFKAYRQSKLGVILMTRLLASKEENQGVNFYAVHPGMVNTDLGRNAGWFSRMIFKLMGKSKGEGARTHIHLIDQTTDSLQSGEYYANSRVVRTTKESYDLEVAERLYNEIARLTTQNDAEV